MLTTYYLGYYIGNQHHVTSISRRLNDIPVEQLYEYVMNGEHTKLGSLLTVKKLHLSYECNALFTEKNEDVTWPPPQWDSLSSKARDQFTLSGKIPVTDYYIAEQQNGQATHWTQSHVDDLGQ
jgi:hypothetical protein